VFADPEQDAPLARANWWIPISGSPLSVREVRREEEEDLRGAGVDSSMCGQEGNGVLHLGFFDCVSDLVFDSRNYFV